MAGQRPAPRRIAWSLQQVIPNTVFTRLTLLIAAAFFSGEPGFAAAGPESQPPVGVVLESPPATPRQKMIVVGAIKMDESAGAVGSLNSRVLVNLRKNLVTDFVKTRKFAVLDREFGDQISAEKHSGEADRSEAGRTMKLGEEATADYLVSVSVKRFTDTRSEQEMRLSGRRIPKYLRELGVAVQVIDVASRRVVFADSFDESAGGALDGVVPGFDLWADEAAMRIASRACNSVLELIYPLKVASVTDSGEVVLNEGAGRVAEGDVYAVYALGKILTDPDTGVEIGREETLQGRVMVVRVLPKAAYAQLESLGTGSIAAGSICRKLQKPEPASIPPGGEAPRAERSGKVKVDDDL